jgi:hypothetical protein
MYIKLWCDVIREVQRVRISEYWVIRIFIFRRKNYRRLPTNVPGVA